MFTVSANSSAKRARIILNVEVGTAVNKRVVEENTVHPIFSRQFRTATGWSIAMPAKVLEVNKRLVKRDIESVLN